MECPHEDVIQKLKTDVWFGDARKPGLTTRAETTEGDVRELQTWKEATDKKYNTILVLLITMLGGLAVDLLVKR